MSVLRIHYLKSKNKMRIDELMIGNLVSVGGYPLTVLTINGESDAFDQVYLESEDDYEWYRLSSIEPIPITEEWLLKLGFNKMSGCFNFDRSKELGHHFGDFALSIYDITQLKFWRGDRYCGVIVCEHVHELQNLFFSLTKEKLKIK